MTNQTVGENIMRLVTAIIAACALFLSFSSPLFSAEVNFESNVKKFIQVIGNGDRKEIAHLVVYPLHRKVPFSSVKAPSQFLEIFDEIMDEALLKTISTSSITDDWSEMGGKGIMFQNGSLWLNEDGKIRAINYETEKGKHNRISLIEADKQKLHARLRNFVEPVLEWETAKYRIRIDQISDNKFRYAVWPVHKKTEELPDLVLRNGTVTYDGSGGNHYYDFKSGDILYRCFVWILGAAESPPGAIYVYKNRKEVLSQPVLKVITGW